MGLLDDIPTLVRDGDPGQFRRLVEKLDVHVWLYFEEVFWGRRKINKVATGVITAGNAPWPIEPYTGPRDGPTDIIKMADTNGRLVGPAGPTNPPSLTKVDRGDSRCTFVNEPCMSLVHRVLSLSIRFNGKDLRSHVSPAHAIETESKTT
jgi:hypothetical protein